MDFRSLTRRELQSLCKKNKIPANRSNVAMADALKALKLVEGIEDFLKPLESESGISTVESPQKSDITTQDVPLSCGRTPTWQKVKNGSENSAVLYSRRRIIARNVKGSTDEGKGGDFPKTPSTMLTNQKGELKEMNTSASQIYSSVRRSARLAAKGEKGQTKNHDQMSETVVFEGSEVNSKQCLDELLDTKQSKASRKLEEEEDANDDKAVKLQDISLDIGPESSKFTNILDVVKGVSAGKGSHCEECLNLKGSSHNVELGLQDSPHALSVAFNANKICKKCEANTTSKAVCDSEGYEAINEHSDSELHVADPLQSKDCQQQIVDLDDKSKTEEICDPEEDGVVLPKQLDNDENEKKAEGSSCTEDKNAAAEEDNLEIVEEGSLLAKLTSHKDDEAEAKETSRDSDECVTKTIFEASSDEETTLEEFQTTDEKDESSGTLEESEHDTESSDEEDPLDEFPGDKNYVVQNEGLPCSEDEEAKFEMSWEGVKDSLGERAVNNENNINKEELPCPEAEEVKFDISWAGVKEALDEFAGDNYIHVKNEVFPCSNDEEAKIQIHQGIKESIDEGGAETDGRSEILQLDVNAPETNMDDADAILAEKQVKTQTSRMDDDVAACYVLTESSATPQVDSQLA
ncbi:unnamed protein product [Cuscuta epithymum]|uniref:Uncharacterized protein n=1 Tax=Cuscuta epithymum TaxID=186058 RepID=A0AAV0EI05_9ASTE|nr:unnamed protein product [Cuscuta epithymum]